jgi:hypothetical protein
MRPFFFILISLAAAATSWAGRPLATEDAYNVGARALELEFGHGLAATYGLADAVDIALEIPLVLSKPEEGDGVFGIGDVAVRAKFVVLGSEEAGPTFAVVPEVKLATGNEEKGLGSGTNDFGGLAVLSYAAGRVTLHGNVGYAYAAPKGGDGEEGHAFLAAATEAALLGPLTVAAEFLADLAEEENEKGEGGGYPMAAGGGLSLAVYENLALDAGVTFGLGAAEGETSATVGATWGVF